ncbi:MAG: hypothetical protein N2235_02955 [Fischerella sp.]|nr:hypothetical protein [Fischerella sp.]
MKIDIEELLTLISNPKKVEYRVYYNSKFDVNKLEAVIEGTESTEKNYIVVDESVYKGIESCELYKIVNGHVVKKISPTFYTLLEKSDPKKAKFTTVKDNMLIAVDEKYTGEKDFWDLKNGN